MKPIYISRPVLDTDYIRNLCRRLGMSDGPDTPHVTVMNSTTPVDWSHPAAGACDQQILIRPQDGLVCRFGRDGEYISLVLVIPEVACRHHQLRHLGARSVYPTFRPHLSLAVNYPGQIPAVIRLTRPIALGPEIVKVPYPLAS